MTTVGNTHDARQDERSPGERASLARATGFRWLGAALVGIALALPGAGALADDSFDDEVAAAIEEAQGWPDYDPSHGRYNGVAADSDWSDSVEAAAIEAQGWPDYDPTRAIEQAAAIKTAAIEAQGWPDYDPSHGRYNGVGIDTAGSDSIADEQGG